MRVVIGGEVLSSKLRSKILHRGNLLLRHLQLREMEVVYFCARLAYTTQVRMLINLHRVSSSCRQGRSDRMKRF